jgi:hypothetical protein
MSSIDSLSDFLSMSGSDILQLNNINAFSSNLQSILNGSTIANETMETFPPNGIWNAYLYLKGEENMRDFAERKSIYNNIIIKNPVFNKSNMDKLSLDYKLTDEEREMMKSALNHNYCINNPEASSCTISGGRKKTKKYRRKGRKTMKRKRNIKKRK